MEVYIDGTYYAPDSGIAQDFISGTLFSSTKPINVLSYYDTSYACNCGIDELAVWDYKLSSSDITALYGAGTPLSSETGLDYVNHFDDIFAPQPATTTDLSTDGIVISFGLAIIIFMQGFIFWGFINNKFKFV